jgi:HD superfamily phosphohydrolase
MVVHDALYGRFVLPRCLTRLASTPELRRLSQIRLLNTGSPSLTVLGELRRYSHTLGVLHLAIANAAKGYSADERIALQASVLLHDIGTPPFGHLVEYHLHEVKGWSHENVIREVLWGRHAPENRAHQIFGGRTIAVRSLLRQSGVSLQLVQAIVSSEHPLSQLLFGTLDLDNLDNIARMAWALGLPGSPLLAVELAQALRVDSQSRLLLDEGLRATVERWARLRERVYDILVFDSQTVAAQAVLSKCVAMALEEGQIGVEDWSMTDEQLVERLRRFTPTKRLISSHYLGELPTALCAVRVRGTLADIGLSSRAAGATLVEQAVKSEVRSGQALGYVFVDSGAFEKHLQFYSPSGAAWQLGETSKSVVLSAFVSGRQKVSRHACQAVAVSIAKSLGVREGQILRAVINDEDDGHDQFRLTL